MKTKLIRLTQNKFAKVDYGDLWWLCNHKWFAQKVTNSNKTSYYAARYNVENGKAKPVLMHREIMHCPPKRSVHHINGDTLDNRRENLRICSRQENNANQYRS